MEREAGIAANIPKRPETRFGKRMWENKKRSELINGSFYLREEAKRLDFSFAISAEYISSLASLSEVPMDDGASVPIPRSLFSFNRTKRRALVIKVSWKKPTYTKVCHNRCDRRNKTNAEWDGSGLLLTLILKCPEISLCQVIAPREPLYSI